MKPRVSFYIVKHRENLWNTGKTQGKHREFDLGKNVATLFKSESELALPTCTGLILPTA